jgi:hypothetical protein
MKAPFSLLQIFKHPIDIEPSFKTRVHQLVKKSFSRVIINELNPERFPWYSDPELVGFINNYILTF